MSEVSEALGPALDRENLHGNTRHLEITLPDGAEHAAGSTGPGDRLLGRRPMNNCGPGGSVTPADGDPSRRAAVGVTLSERAWGLSLVMLIIRPLPNVAVILANDALDEGGERPLE